MTDALFVLVVVAFFAAAAAFVAACDRIIGPDPLPDPVTEPTDRGDAEVAAR